MPLLVLSLMTGCEGLFKPAATPNPMLQWEAFDSIGREGLLAEVSMDQLQGAYDGKATFVFDADKGVGGAGEGISVEISPDDEFVCTGTFEGNRLILSLTLSQSDVVVFDDIPPCIIEDGILTAPGPSAQGTPDESNQTLVCAIKTYPSGRMMDGLFKTELVDKDGNAFPAALHFQLILDEQ